jgi:hypothetical protein
VSYSDQPIVPPLKKVGCIIYCIVATLFVVLMVLGAALGDCPRNDDGTGCENDALIKFLMFPGSLILVIVIGIFLARWAVRNESDG